MAGALVICPTAIANGKIEKTVGTKSHDSAVMIGLRLIETEDFAATREINLILVSRIDPPFGDHLLMIVRRASRHRDRKVCRGPIGFRRVGIDQRVVSEVGMDR